MGKDGIVSCHDNCKIHKEVIVSWHEYVKNTESGTTVDKRMDASRAKTISNNCHCLKTILEVLWYAANRKLHYKVTESL